MAPIIRSKIPPTESIPHFPRSETKLSVVLDKSQDIILELLINYTEINLAWEELSQNKEKYISNLEHTFGKGSKGNKLKAPYKDRQGEIKIYLRQQSKIPSTIKILKNPCFIRREWLESRQQWDWREGETNEDEDGKTLKRGMKEREHKVGRKVDKGG